MKKILLSLFITVLLIPIQAGAHADHGNISIPTTASTTTTIEEVVTTKMTTSDKKEQIQYDYYFSPTCGWCQKLNKFFDKNNAFKKLNINKIDVNDHAIEFMNVAESVGVSRPGTPFIVYEENGEKKYISGGFYKIIDYFSKELGVKLPNNTSIHTNKHTTNNSIYIILLGLLIIVGPLTYLGFKK